MAVGDVWQSRAVFSDTLTGRSSSIGLHHSEIAGGFPVVGVIGDTWKNWWNVGAEVIPSPQKSHHPAGLQLDLVTLRRVSPLDPNIATYTTGLPIIGTGVGDGLPPNAAVVVSLRTANIGKRFRGRVFLPRIVEVDSTGAVTDAEATEMANEFHNLIVAFNTASAPVGVFSPARPGPLPPARSQAMTLVTSERVDRRLRVQRRRQPRAPVYITGV